MKDAVIKSLLDALELMSKMENQRFSREPTEWQTFMNSLNSFFLK